ncbi:MAG: sporulation initiation factor Spo0A C-terminal domain-containing protein [Lachnospiraceae bacterium]|nr:sporulation initiation factor Spo0A C-terminal domain-containing protein [Lachnospiraceae bacterium]
MTKANPTINDEKQIVDVENSVHNRESEQNLLISNQINHELDLVGISAKNKGRVYLYEAIYLKIADPSLEEAAINEVANKRHLQYGTIAKVMQTAIKNAWYNTAIENWEKHYTANISSKKGLPTSAEFIHYYVDKINRITRT